MTVLDVISKHRETEAVFRQYDEEAGECICCQALFESIKNVAKKYDLDMEKFMNDLNAAVLSENREPNRGPDRKPIRREFPKNNLPILLALLLVFYVAITGT